MMNENTGELKYLDKLTEEEKKSGKWKEIRSREEQLKQMIGEPQDIEPLKSIMNRAERRRAEAIARNK